MEVDAFSWRCVDFPFNFLQFAEWYFFEIGAFGQEPSDSAIGVFDGSFLLRRMRIAEVGFEVERLADFVMCGELHAIIHRDRFSCMWRYIFDGSVHCMLGMRFGFMPVSVEQCEAGFALNHRQ